MAEFENGEETPKGEQDWGRERAVERNIEDWTSNVEL